MAPWRSASVCSLLLRPLLQRHALAHPNARSSHKIPTPQGGGYAVIAATAGIVGGASLLLGEPGVGNQSLWLVLAATVFLAVVGAVDDLHTIAVLPRLVLQAVCDCDRIGRAAGRIARRAIASVLA